MKQLADITARYIGKPFKMYGCIEIVVKLMEELETPLPDEVDGWDVKNYKDLVKEDIHKAQDIMLGAFNKIGKPSNIKFPKLGDLLIIEQKGDVKFPAIYVGKGQAIASFIKRGVQIFRIDDLNKIILCRRIQ